MVYKFLFITLKNISNLFFILKTFYSTLNSWIGEFVFWCHEQVTSYEKHCHKLCICMIIRNQKDFCPFVSSTTCTFGHGVSKFNLSLFQDTLQMALSYMIKFFFHRIYSRLSEKLHFNSLTWRPGGSDCFSFSAFSLSLMTRV